MNESTTCNCINYLSCCFQTLSRIHPSSLLATFCSPLILLDRCDWYNHSQKGVPLPLPVLFLVGLILVVWRRWKELKSILTMYIERYQSWQYRLREIILDNVDRDIEKPWSNLKIERDLGKHYIIKDYWEVSHFLSNSTESRVRVLHEHEFGLVRRKCFLQLFPNITLGRNELFVSVLLYQSMKTK